MGFFDFLRKSGSNPPPPPQGPAVDRKVAGPAKVAGDKRAQNYDRMDALQQLAGFASAEAAAALLRRFTFTIDPSITDQEEKDVAFQGVLAAGSAAVPAVLAFCEKAEQLTWPLKILRELLEDDDFRDELIDMTKTFDTEYARNVEPKIQVIVALEGVVNDEVMEAVAPFLDDVNETVRFHAVQTTFAQNDAKSLPALAALLAKEESVRIKNKVAEGILFRGWTIPADLRDTVATALRDTDGYRVGPDDKLMKSASSRR